MVVEKIGINVLLKKVSRRPERGRDLGKNRASPRKLHRGRMKKGMPMREAYRKAGLPPEDMDWEAMGMDIKTCGRELTIRPARYASRGLSAGVLWHRRCARRRRLRC
jgi:hypothetical protein